MSALAVLLSAAAAAGAAWLATALTLPLLRARAILDHPSGRSSHSAPIPRGGGLAVVGAATAGWALAAAFGPASWQAVSPVLAAALALALVSWFDDLGGLPPAPRLLAQGAAVALVMALAPPGLVFQGALPPLWDGIAAALLWLWFVNLFNFMDGIDGIAAVETICIGAGAALVALAGGLDRGPALLAALLAAAALGFLPWNWQPARIFLGDVGSVPVGFLLGWLLLDLAGRGAWAAALLLPAYYLADASWTLARRALRGAVLWRAHREHFYQRAVAGRLSHARASTAVLLIGVVLIACAIAAQRGGDVVLPALLAGAVSVAGLLWYFHRAAASAPPPP